MIKIGDVKKLVENGDIYLVTKVESRYICIRKIDDTRTVIKTLKRYWNDEEMFSELNKKETVEEGDIWRHIPSGDDYRIGKVRELTCQMIGRGGEVIADDYRIGTLLESKNRN